MLLLLIVDMTATKHAESFCVAAVLCKYTTRIEYRHIKCHDYRILANILQFCKRNMIKRADMHSIKPKLYSTDLLIV